MLNPMSIVDEAQRDEPEISPDDGSVEAIADQRAEDGPTDPAMPVDLESLAVEEARLERPAVSDSGLQGSRWQMGDGPPSQEAIERMREHRQNAGRERVGRRRPQGDGSPSAQDIQRFRERRSNTGEGREGRSRQGGNNAQGQPADSSEGQTQVQTPKGSS